MEETVVVKRPVSSLKKVSQERIDKVIEMHDAGHSQNHIAGALSMTCRTAQAILEKHGRKRTRTEQSYYHHKQSTLREDAFDIVTDEMAYWLGFIYADGFITNPDAGKAKKYTVGILLQIGDVKHLEKFKEFLKAPQKLTTATSRIEGRDKVYQNVRINIGSQRIHSKLQDWGITWNKSYDAKPPEVLKDNRNFWRGVVDGDGYLGLINDTNRPKPRKRLHLCGTIDMVEGFKQFLIRSGVNTAYTVAQVRDSVQHRMEINTTMADKAVRVLYEGATVYLDRKYEKYLEIIKQSE